MKPAILPFLTLLGLSACADPHAAHGNSLLLRIHWSVDSRHCEPATLDQDILALANSLVSGGECPAYFLYQDIATQVADVSDHGAIVEYLMQNKFRCADTVTEEYEGTYCSFILQTYTGGLILDHDTPAGSYLWEVHLPRNGPMEVVVSYTGYSEVPDHLHY